MSLNVRGQKIASLISQIGFEVAQAYLEGNHPSTEELKILNQVYDLVPREFSRAFDGGFYAAMGEPFRN